MRYSLRALLIATTFAPPLMAWVWVHGRERERWSYILGALLFGLAGSVVILVWRGDLHWSILEDRRRIDRGQQHQLGLPHDRHGQGCGASISSTGPSTSTAKMQSPAECQPCNPTVSQSAISIG